MDGVQKLRAHSAMKPVWSLMASVESASTRVLALPSWYCFRLPIQRGLASGSGRNMPTYSWFRWAPCTLALAGKLTAANTLLTDWIFDRALLMALAIAALPLA